MRAHTPTHTCARTHTHTHRHTHTHTHTQTHMHAHRHKHACPCTHTHKVHAYTRAGTCMHKKQKHKRSHTDTHHTHTHTTAGTQASTRTHMLNPDGRVCTTQPHSPSDGRTQARALTHTRACAHAPRLYTPHTTRHANPTAATADALRMQHVNGFAAVSMQNLIVHNPVVCTR
jgi:hypothetical protein